MRDILKHMEKKTTRDQVAEILRMPADKQLRDKTIEVFVTQYSSGDFLSIHDDAIGSDDMPTYAFVVSLTQGPTWQPEFGGELQFLIAKKGQRKPSWDAGFGPQFNRAMFFKTSDPAGPFHRVSAVTQQAEDAGWLRFGFTGWSDSNDAF